MSLPETDQTEPSARVEKSPVGSSVLQLQGRHESDPMEQGKSQYPCPSLCFDYLYVMTLTLLTFE